MDVDIVLDGGAYTTLSDLVLLRAALHAAGPYQCEHLTIRARAVATNHPPRGAFRGFGAPQTLFAVEAHWDYCVARLGIDTVELRRKTLLAPGGTMATGQHLIPPVARICQAWRSPCYTLLLSQAPFFPGVQHDNGQF